MGCPEKVDIEDDLVFSICSHDPDTGILTDADSAPSYRLYEDETATPILTGTMAKLDDANTTGLYTELIACTRANGFEDSKTYTIYIEAMVDSDTGGICYAFKMHFIGAPLKLHFTAISTKVVHFSAVSSKGLHFTAKSGKALHFEVTE